MTGIRIVTVATPAVLRDLIDRLVASRIDFRVVAQFNARRALPRRLKAIQPDLVVIGLRGNETAAVIRALLAQLPATKFIAFSGDAQSVLGFELRLHQTDLRAASADEMIAFIANMPPDSGYRRRVSKARRDLLAGPGSLAAVDQAAPWATRD